MSAPAYPAYHLTTLGQVLARNGKTATIWKATTTHHGQTYSLMGPLRVGGLPHSPYINDPDAAREAIERRLPHQLRKHGADL